MGTKQLLAEVEKKRCVYFSAEDCPIEATKGGVPVKYIPSSPQLQKFHLFGFVKREKKISVGPLIEYLTLRYQILE
jgi:hypothetical protein